MPDTWAAVGSDLHVAITRPGVRASLEQALRDAVQSGRLRPGTRLPSSRSLAADLDISRNTVAEVYVQLAAEGWLTARRGSVTRVAAGAASEHAEHRPGHVAERAAVYPYDLRSGEPNMAAFPRKEWLAAVRAGMLHAPNEALGYEDGRGNPKLREALAAYLGRVRAVQARPDSVLICSGTIHAFSMLCAVLKARGASTVAFEEYGYSRFTKAAALQGLQTVTIGVDGAGARVDQLDALRADAVLLTPGHQFPTGTMLSADRRRAVIEWARRTGGLVIEDDYDGEFRYEPLAAGSLQELAPELVAYVGTTSKSLVPGLRIGWAVLPDKLVSGAVEMIATTVGQISVMEQVGLAEFIRCGAYDRHVRRARTSYRRRRDRLILCRDRLAPDVRVTGIAAGLHAVLELPGRAGGPVAERALVERAGRRGLALHGLSAFELTPGTAAPLSIVVGYGTPPDHAFEPALRTLFEVISATDIAS
ncbi:MAG: PLP-dependent aminotransferase family protein [Jatrophihabitans sp.]